MALSFRPSLEDLAICAVQVGRNLGEAIRSCRPPHGGLDWPRVAATQRRLLDGDVLDSRDTIVLEILETALKEAIIVEVTGSQPEFVYVGYDEEGDEAWALVMQPTYSRRGAKLLEIQEHLKELLDLRRLINDRITARKVLTSSAGH